MQPNDYVSVVNIGAHDLKVSYSQSKQRYEWPWWAFVLLTGGLVTASVMVGLGTLVVRARIKRS